MKPHTSNNLRILTALCLSLWAAGPRASAQEADYTYTTANGAVTITGYKGFGGAVTIPDTITGLPVTSIGPQAFRMCTNLTSITIPNGVTSIGYDAFGFCRSLTGVTMGNSVTRIGNWAFNCCSSLIQVTIPNGVTTIGSYAFDFCSSLTSVTIANSVTNIGDGAFSHCTSLTSITIPDSVTNIGDSAFRECTSLTSIVIPNGVTSIGSQAFAVCTSLTNVTIPDSVTSIGWGAFNFCNSLTSLTIPNSLLNVGLALLRGVGHPVAASGLRAIKVNESIVITGYVCSTIAVNIPDTINGLPVTRIGAEAFRACSSLTSVIIPNSVTSIGDAAFSGCVSLTNVAIRSSVISIRSGAFSECSSLVTLDLKGNGLTHFTFPDGLTSLVRLDLSSNQLTKFTLPMGLTNLRELYLAHNPLTTLGLVSDLQSLTVLDLRETSLTTLVLPEALVAVLNPPLETLRSQGVAVYVYPLETPIYVSLESTTPVPPYISWAMAANVIQDAVDVAKAGDTVLVTNGVYRTGARESFVWHSDDDPPEESVGLSRVVLTNAVALRSVNGPAVTVIEGAPFVIKDGTYVGGDVRCVFAVTNAVVSGFTLTKASLYISSGGGAYGGTLTNCVVTDNSALGGGGAYGSTLYNCTVTGNSGAGAGYSTLYGCTVADNPRAGVLYSTLYNCAVTGNRGGGAVRSTLYNCTVTANSALLGMIAQFGGGAYRSTLYNCVLAGNKALLNGGGAYRSSLYSCTVTGNSVTSEDGGESYGQGGGCYGGRLYNCIVYNNQALNGPNWANDSNFEKPIAFAYSCTSPLPTDGIGNIDADPRFVNAAGGDFRLRPDSPCIDSGTNLMGFPVTGWSDELGDWVVLAQISDATDILGHPRGGDGNGDGKSGWDMGAYEYDPTVPIITQASVTAVGLTIQWNVGAIGAKLQRATSLTQPDWRDLQGSEKTNRAVLPIYSGSEFFRLVKP